MIFVACAKDSAKTQEVNKRSERERERERYIHRADLRLSQSRLASIVIDDRDRDLADRDLDRDLADRDRSRSRSPDCDLAFCSDFIIFFWVLFVF